MPLSGLVMGSGHSCTHLGIFTINFKDISALEIITLLPCEINVTYWARSYFYSCILRSKAYAAEMIEIMPRYPSWLKNRIRAGKKKGKGFLLQAWNGSWGSRRLWLLYLLDFRHCEGGKVVTLTHRPPSLIFRGWVDPRAHGSVGSLYTL